MQSTGNVALYQAQHMSKKSGTVKDFLFKVITRGHNILNVEIAFDSLLHIYLKRKSSSTLLHRILSL